MKPIQLLTLKFSPAELAPLQEFLENKCLYWNSLKHRTFETTSPHREVDDIWAHYGDQRDPRVAANDQPIPMRWYFKDLAALCLPLAEKLTQHVGGSDLGFVLFTRIPAGKQVYPHVDGGWHAGVFTKYCICVRANKEQSFYFPDAELRTETGDVFWFDNSQSHGVTNNSSEARISMITCIKTPRGIHVP